MTWTRLSDDYADRPSLLGVSRSARLLDVEALIYCNKHSTDGYLSAAALRRITDAEDPKADVAELVSSGVWSDVETGWQLDWSDQEPAERVRRGREFRAEKQRRYRDRKSRHEAGDHSACDPRYCRAVTGNETGHVTLNVLAPVPSRPVPTEGQGQGARRSRFDADASTAAHQGDSLAHHHEFAPDESGITCTKCGTGPSNRRHHPFESERAS